MHTRHHTFISRARRRSGHTLVELVIVLAIISIVSAIVFPLLAPLVDQADVFGATADAEALFATARATAIAMGAPVTVEIDTVNQLFIVRMANDTIRRRNEHEIHNVRLHATRTTMAYSPTGMGYGVANLTLIIAKHAFADTIVVSRLGRVRRE